MKKTSLVITTYNGERYIEEELDSIKNQTKQIDEVLISDDGSSDNTYQIIENYILKNNLTNWHLSQNKNNKGFSLNFIDTLFQCTGDIIFLADQDDIWFENKVEKMIEILNDNLEIKAIGSEFVFIDSNGNFTIPPKGIPNTYCILDDSITYVNPMDNIASSYMRGCTMCVTADILKYIKDNNLATYCSNSLLGHDWLLWMIASLLGKTCILHTPLIKYRIHNNNTSLEAVNRNNLLGDKNARINGLKKSILIHEYIEINQAHFKNISSEFLKKIHKYILFEKDRLDFLVSKKIFIYFNLFFHLKYYSSYYRSFFKGIKVFIGDFLYAFKR